MAAEVDIKERIETSRKELLDLSLRNPLREDVLEGLGCKLHRIWSTDWFQNPERELARAVEAIENARQYG